MFPESEFARAFEITPIPIIPVSGMVGSPVRLTDGSLVFTFFQEVPMGGQIERHICLRTMWSPFAYRAVVPRILPVLGGRVAWVGAH